MKYILSIINSFSIIFSLFKKIINILYNKSILSYIIYKWSYMIKLLDQKIYIFMDEYYVLLFYQMNPTIEYYLV